MLQIRRKIHNLFIYKLVHSEEKQLFGCELLHFPGSTDYDFSYIFSVLKTQIMLKCM